MKNSIILSFFLMSFSLTFVGCSEPKEQDNTSLLSLFLTSKSSESAVISETSSEDSDDNDEVIEESTDSPEDPITPPIEETVPVEETIIKIIPLQESVYIESNNQKQVYFRCSSNKEDVEFNLDIDSIDLDTSNFYFEDLDSKITCNNTFEILNIIPSGSLVDGIYHVSLSGEFISNDGGVEVEVDFTFPIYVGNYYIQLDPGTYHTLALNAEGKVFSWGGGSFPLGDGLDQYSYKPVEVVGLDNMIQVSSGEKFSLALKQDGTVWSWGENGQGQLGIGTTTQALFPTQVLGINGIEFLTDVIKISAGKDHCLALKKDGSVVSWGNNDYGQLGQGNVNGTNDSLYPKNVVSEDQNSMFSNVIDLDTNGSHSLALKNDSTPRSWGKNSNYQLGLGNTTSFNVPQIVNRTSIIKVSAGNSFSIILTAYGNLMGTGSNIYNQLYPFPYGTNITSFGSMNFTHENPIIDLSTGGYHTFAMDSEGVVYSFGYNNEYQNGHENTDYRTSASQGIVSKLTGAIFPKAGNSHSVTLKQENEKLTGYAFGNNSSGQLGEGTNYDYTDWGSNQYYDFNIDGFLKILNPGESIAYNQQGLTNVNQISVGLKHTLVLKNDGSIFGIGGNLEKELSLEKLVHYVAEGTKSELKDKYGDTLTDIKQVESAGENFSVLLKNDGTVWATGNCFYLGSTIEHCNDDTDEEITFLEYFQQVQVENGTGILDNVKQISVGDDYVIALKNDGTVWSWGDDWIGQLGNGSEGYSPTPVKVVTETDGSQLSNIDKIITGTFHSLALSKTGYVYAWGNNTCGQTGNASTITSCQTGLYSGSRKSAGFVYINSSKVPLSGIKDIAAGVHHSLALTKDSDGNRIYAWGSNFDGELGNNTIPVDTNNSQYNALSVYPVFVQNETETGDLTWIQKITAGGDIMDGFSFGIKADQTGLSWGFGEYGNLCNNKFDRINVTPTLMLNSNLDPIQDIQEIYTGQSSTTFIQLSTSTEVLGCGNNDYNSYLGIGKKGGKYSLPQMIKERID